MRYRLPISAGEDAHSDFKMGLRMVLIPSDDDDTSGVLVITIQGAVMPLYHCRPINFTNANTSPPLPSPSSSSPSSYVCVGVCV
jgi:hypothetical protein